MWLYKKRERGEMKELKKLIKAYFKCIRSVPMRAVDCDQELEEDLRIQIKRAIKKGEK